MRMLLLSAKEFGNKSFVKPLVIMFFTAKLMLSAKIQYKSGHKTHEYRNFTPYWENRLQKFEFSQGYFVQFQKAYRKNPERMTFKIDNIRLVDGKNTDLHIDGLVFDIELGERIR